MKFELFINLDCESVIFYEQIRGEIKNTTFSQNPNDDFQKVVF